MLGEGVSTFIQYIRKSSALNSSQFSSSADEWRLCSVCNSTRVVEGTPHACMMAAGNTCPRQRELSLHYCAVCLGLGQTCTAFACGSRDSIPTHCASRRNPGKIRRIPRPFRPLALLTPQGCLDAPELFPERPPASCPSLSSKYGFSKVALLPRECP